MMLIIWGALLAVTLLGSPAATQSCIAIPIGVYPKNLALGKPTHQSSTYPNVYGGPSGKAVDGRCSGIWTQGSCTHTNQDTNSWWMVDLRKTYKIYMVVVKNREDCCSDRLFGAEVRVGDSLENNGRYNRLCGIIYNTSPGSISILYCKNHPGRYISVHLPGKQYLTLCEVEAYSVYY